MEGGPWAFDNHPLIYECVRDGDDPDMVELEQLALWVQIHGLLVGYMPKVATQSFGNRL